MECVLYFPSPILVLVGETISVSHAKKYCDKRFLDGVINQIPDSG